VIVTAVTEHVPKLIYCPHNLTWNQRAKLEIILGAKNRVSDGQKYSGAQFQKKSG